MRKINRSLCFVPQTWWLRKCHCMAFISVAWAIITTALKTSHNCTFPFPLGRIFHVKKLYWDHEKIIWILNRLLKKYVNRWARRCESSLELYRWLTDESIHLQNGESFPTSLGKNCFSFTISPLFSSCLTNYNCLIGRYRYN